ncbi:MAG: hypothetical protein QW655_06500 [Nitrososphaerota archaeon]
MLKSFSYWILKLSSKLFSKMVKFVEKLEYPLLTSQTRFEI